MSVDKDLVSVQQARDLVEAAHRAQAEVAQFDQAKIDRICEAMAKAALREAARLGAMAVEETGFGVPDDKREKNRFAAEDVWNYFRGLRTKGVVSESKDVVEIASPRGVVAGIIPSTNPTSTAIFKILIAIKSRNTVVLSPHPSAAKCINETARVMREAGVKEGLPADAIGCMTTATIEGTETLMKHKQTAVILATGGIGLVRAAYSSGKPAFGVGPGNVPVCIERTRRRSESRAGHFDRQVFRQRHDLRVGAGGGLRRANRAGGSRTVQTTGRAFSFRGGSRSTRQSRRHAAAFTESGNRRQVGGSDREDGRAERAAGHALFARGRWRRRTRVSVVDGKALADSRVLRRRWVDRRR